LVKVFIPFGIKITMTATLRSEMYLIRHFISDPDRAIKIDDINNTVVSWWNNRYNINLPVRVIPAVSDDEREKCLAEVRKLFKYTVDTCRRNCIRRLIDYATTV
jgi:hypothetical protein